MIFEFFQYFIFSFEREYKNTMFGQIAFQIKTNYDYYEQNNKEQ